MVRILKVIIMDRHGTCLLSSYLITSQMRYERSFLNCFKGELLGNEFNQIRQSIEGIFFTIIVINEFYRQFFVLIGDAGS